MNNIARMRRGALAVEMAMVAPIFLLLIFVSFEFARINMVRHAIANASYAACRHVIVPGATLAEAESKAQQILQISGVVDAEITFDPAEIQEDTPFVLTTITVPCRTNTWGGSFFFRDRSLETTTTLRTERVPVFQAGNLPTVISPPPVEPPPEPQPPTPEPPPEVPPITPPGPPTPPPTPPPGPPPVLL